MSPNMVLGVKPRTLNCAGRRRGPLSCVVRIALRRKALGGLYDTGWRWHGHVVTVL